MIDWEGFLKANGIHYVTYGPNTKAGEVSVKCPFCGPEDPSQHMGINLKREVWSCWRNRSHAGKKPHRLIMALLGCSYAQARNVVAQFSASDPDELVNYIKPQRNKLPKRKKEKHLAFPPEFRTVNDSGLQKRFWKYLKGRGFHDVDALVERYNIQCANTGVWASYLVFPIYDGNRLVCWQGRALGSTIKAPRYRALSTSEGALIEIKDHLFNEKSILKGGKLLVVVEGMVDFLKLDFYNKARGVKITCTFGTHLTQEQIYLLADLSKVYDKVIILFDEEAIDSQLEVLKELDIYGVEAAALPPGIEDPGALERHQVPRVLKGFYRKYVGNF